MEYEQIEAHLADLGITSLGDSAPAPTDKQVWREISERTGGETPDMLSRLSQRYNGFRFPNGAFYHDPCYGHDVMVGWFLDSAELLQTFEDTRDTLPDDVVPIANDGSDNHLAIGVGPSNSGVIYFHIHDAPTDSHLYRLSDSVEHFLLSLHREDGDGVHVD
ncbi:SMI1/KNR4 family protein [Amycolatopsis sp. NPDC004747]